MYLVWALFPLGFVVIYFLIQESVLKNKNVIVFLKTSIWNIRYRSPTIMTEIVPYSMLVSKRREEMLLEYLTVRKTFHETNNSLLMKAYGLTKEGFFLEKYKTPRIFQGETMLQRFFYQCRSRETNTMVPLLFCFNAISSVTKKNRSILTSPNKISYWKLNNEHYRELYSHFTFPGESREKEYLSYNVTLNEIDLFYRQVQYLFFSSVHQLLNYLNITFIAHSGTLLGLLRHDSMIPWDDDMDFLIPYHDLCKLLGFFSQGNHTMYAIKDSVMNENIKCWWNHYNLITNEKERMHMLNFFISQIELYANTPFDMKSFSVKLFCKQCRRIHPYPWNYPYVDIFVFHIISTVFEKKLNTFSLLNAKATCDSAFYKEFKQKEDWNNLWIHVVYTNVTIPIKEVFPLRWRYLYGKKIAVAFQLDKTLFSDIPENVYETCYNGGWSHIYEIGRYGYSIPCFLLYSYIPFVTLRQRKYFNTTLFKPFKLRSIHESTTMFNVLQDQCLFYNSCSFSGT
jgi:phosphorylcholine metabolism protein LicD